MALDGKPSNEFLRDAAIRHAIFTERLKAAEVKKVMAFLNRKALPELERLLHARLSAISFSGFSRGKRTTQRLASLASAINDILGKSFRAVRPDLYNALVDVGAFEAKWQTTRMDEGTGGLQLDFVTPSRGQIRSIISSRPMQGTVLNGWWAGLARNAGRRIEEQINVGLALGETGDQIVRRITGPAGARRGTAEFAKLRRNTEAVTRTAINHINSHARELTYEANSDVIKGVQYVATLDSRTTEICMGLDGQVFQINEGPRPPMHFGCRSTTTPVLKSFRALGIGGLRELPPGTRASMNGQVAATQTYGPWLKRQKVSVQNEALGPTRAALFRRGQVSIDRFTDQRHRPLTLQQIQVRENIKTLPGESQGAVA